jgi:phospholipase C
MEVSIMTSSNRRTFLKLMGSPVLAAALPPGIARALSIPANHRTGTIRDVEHIVILTQENRSFDHYFGTMRGVRGFADPFPVKLPSGLDVWHQPNGAGVVMPFRPFDDMGMRFLPDPPHGWNDGHAAWNEGRYDRWIPNKGVKTMTYHTRRDIPYHYALADAFTICDAYHCSVMGPTDPNRYHMWTGWVGNDGSGGGPVITNAEEGYDWSTYPERLQRAGISWKVYQDAGDGLDAAGFWGWTGDPFIGNYGDNSLLYFHQYQNALPGTPLAENAKTGTTIKAQGRNPDALVEMFRNDVLTGQLPQISWIAAPEAYTEHPNWPPNWGAWYVSQFLDALTSNPDVWSKTVFFLNFDEEGGFFDHMVPPTPPQTPMHGSSTVSTVNEIYTAGGGHPDGPYGLGVRVPLIAISPWSKGGWVDSELFDHTSLIKFIEARHAQDNPDLVETNITPWRRAVVGDLTGAFDFAKPNGWKMVELPGTSQYRPQSLVGHPDEIIVPPVNQHLPGQEEGVRPARALPYALHARAVVRTADGSVRIDFENVGQSSAVFHVRSGDPADVPRNYTMEPGRQLSGSWNVGGTGASDYDLSVYGPNGFFRRFKGSIVPGRTNLDVRATYDANTNAITLTIANLNSASVTITVLDKYSGHAMGESIESGASVSKRWSLARFDGWYDFVITAAYDDDFEQQLAGHLETGKDSVSDPAMGGLVRRAAHAVVA